MITLNTPSPLLSPSPSPPLPSSFPAARSASEGKVFGKYTGVDISRSMLDAAKTVMQAVKASPLGVQHHPHPSIKHRPVTTGYHLSIAHYYCLFLARYCVSVFDDISYQQIQTVCFGTKVRRW